MNRASLEAVIQRSAPLRDRIGGIFPGISELPRSSGAPRLYYYSASPSQMPRLPGDPAPEEQRIMPQVPGAGVSADPLEAQVRAIGESIERYCMCVYDQQQFVRATAEELGELAIDLERLATCAPSEHSVQHNYFVRPRKDVPLRWVKGISLISGEPRYVPAMMVFLHFPPEHRDEQIWIPISTGCACHTDLVQALVSGICEIVERDSLMLTWLHQLPLPRIDLGDESQWPDRLRLMMELTRESHLEYHFFDATSDLGIPCIYALQLNDHTSLLSNLVVSAVRLDPVQAIVRVLEEGCTSRVALDSRLGVARPNPAHREHPEQIFSLEDCALYYALREARSDFDFLLSTSHVRRLSEIPNLATGSPESDLELLLERFRERDMEVVAVDLTTPEVRQAGFWVVRVIIPEMIPLSPAYGVRFLDTPRLYTAPEAMGYGRRTINDITPKPQPFA